MGYRNTVLELNPIAYWRLGESSGTSAVDEVGAYQGTYIGSPTLAQQGLLVDDLDTAVTFDGSTNYFKETSLGTNPPGNTGTVSYLCKLNQVGDIGVLIFGNESDNDTLLYFYMYEGTIAYTFRNNTGTSGTNYFNIIADGDINVGETHLVTFVQDDTDFVHLYLDGIKLETYSSSGTPNNKWWNDLTTNYLAIGVGLRNSGNNYYSATVDEVAIFNYSLNSDQILDMFRQSIGYTNNPTNFEEYVKYLLPESYWRFGESVYLGLLDDNFTGEDGDPPNNDIWGFGDGSTIQNNQLYSNSDGNVSTVTYSKFELKDDFDITVDWSNFNVSGGTPTNFARCCFMVVGGGYNWQIYRGIENSLNPFLFP